MITLLKVLLILSLSFFAAHGIIDRYRTWTRKKGVRFIIDVTNTHDNVMIRGLIEHNKLFTSPEEEAILDFLKESNKELISFISTEKEIKRLTENYTKRCNEAKERAVLAILNQNPNDDSKAKNKKLVDAFKNLHTNPGFGDESDNDKKDKS